MKIMNYLIRTFLKQFKRVTREVYEQSDGKIPNWLCAVIVALTIPINLLIMLIMFLGGGVKGLMDFAKWIRKQYK